MLDRVDAIVTDLKTNPPPLRVDEIAEAIQFLQWLLADNFTFLGVRDYAVDGQGLEPEFRQRARHHAFAELRVLKRGSELLEITPEIMAFLKEPRLLIIAKANIHARVHRRVYLDYIGVKRFDPSGKLIGEHRIIGLFTSTAYTRTAHSIPYLRRKIAAVEQRADFDPSSHSGKALANVLEHYPRDELFQIDEDTLYQLCARDPATRRASARTRPRAARSFRPFRVGARVRTARTLRQPHSSEDRRLFSEHFYWAGFGLLSVFPGRRAAGARAFHYRPFWWRDACGGTRNARTRSCGHYSHLDRRPDPGAGAWSTRRTRRVRSSIAIATRSPKVSMKPMRPLSRPGTSASSKASQNNVRSASTFITASKKSNAPSA